MGSPADLVDVLDLVVRHEIVLPLVDRESPLVEAATAHRYPESGAAFGKVVLRP
ncbi:zinc-binding dehydrogenase [Pseudonocardia xishanensis]|uniref:Zinc-binding alcohol dehydrogenase family protein n=1 Tax=Pseudonocardia xishanensis TaxID=630995 RepID=A0ABP8S389_9PSEU